MMPKFHFDTLKPMIGKRALVFAMIGLIFSFFLGFLELLNANILLLLVQKLGFATAENKLNFLGPYNPSFELILILFSGSAVLKFATQLLTSQSMAYASETICMRLKSLTIYDMLFGISPGYLGAGELFFRFNEVIPKMVNGITAYFSMISVLIQALILITTMFISLPRESVLSLIVILFIGVVTLMSSRLIPPLSHSVTSESVALSNQVQRSTRNLAFFKIMRTQRREHIYLTNTVKNLSQHVLNLNLVTTFASSLTPLIGVFLVVTIIYFSLAVFHTSGLLIISFLYLMMRFIQSLGTLSQLFSQAQSNSAQFKIGVSYLKNFKVTEIETVLAKIGRLNSYGKNNFISLDHMPKENLSETRLAPPHIRVNGLSFSYGKQKIINKVSFEILPGESFAICGESGAGKSTLLSLMLGLYSPDTGTISIDGKTANDYFADEANRIGYVGAEPYLIKGTIRENLLYGIPHLVTDPEITKALTDAHLQDLIQKVGLNHEIQEDHSGISAGQKQRICLARALLNKPSLLILDEATANLDSNTEDSIRETISNLQGECTIVIVSHRPNFIKNISKKLSL